MILLWGLPGDRPLAKIRDLLAEREAPVVLFDQRAISESEVQLEVGPTLNGRLEIAGLLTDLSQVTAAYVRPYDFRQLPEFEGAPPESPAVRHAADVEDALMAWLDFTEARVVNRFDAMASNNSKPYQAEIIRSFGFGVPRTLVTTDPAAAAEFWSQHGEVVYKSISGIRSIVSRLDETHRERLDDVRWCPTQFQEYVPGTDYRVHVVSGAVFPCRIQSAGDDYRYASRKNQETTIEGCCLPAEIAGRCVGLAQALKLLVAGLDLRQKPNGEWVCFEVNPSPAFTYFQSQAGQPIGEAIADLLCAA